MSNAFETLLLLILDHCSLIIVLCLLFFTTEAAELHGGFTMTIATEDTENNGGKEQGMDYRFSGPACWPRV